MDVFGGEVRRRDVFPLLALHLIAREPAYGNRLIEEIEAITDGVISVNPNTIYPLLRDLEARGLIEGQWEHPDRRTRRFYSITPAGRKEYRRLVDRARAVPRLGDPVGDPDQARDLRVSAISEIGRGRRLARRSVGLLLRSRRLARVGRRLRACRWRRTAIRRLAARCVGARSRPAGARSPSACSSTSTDACIGSHSAIPPAPESSPPPSPSRGDGTPDRAAPRVPARERRPVRMAHRSAVHPLPGAGIDAPLARPPQARAGARMTATDSRRTAPVARRVQWRLPGAQRPVPPSTTLRG